MLICNCMWVCMCTCLQCCQYTYTYFIVHTNAWTFTYMYTYTYTHAHVCIRAYMRICTCPYKGIPIPMHTSAYTTAYIHPHGRNWNAFTVSIVSRVHKSGRKVCFVFNELSASACAAEVLSLEGGAGRGPGMLLLGASAAPSVRHMLGSIE